MEGEQIEFTEAGKVLGLSLSRTGIIRHIKEICNKSKAALVELYRFDNLPTKIKTHLIKAFILPILHYPPIPLLNTSKTTQLKLQRIQNKALRYAFNEKYPYTRNTEELHRLAGIQPINTTLFTRGEKTFNKIMDIEDTTWEEIKNNYEPNKDHSWFKKTRNIIHRGQPQETFN